MAIKTTLGYVLSGQIAEKLGSTTRTFTVTNTFKIGLGEDKIAKSLNRFWEVESLGIEKLENVEEKIEKNIAFEEGRYAVDLPKKFGHPVLDDNFQNAKNRLLSLQKRLGKDQNLKETYKQAMQEKIERGVVERVESEGEVGNTYYMPHTAVVRDDRETTKTRIVFDASAKQKSTSLNDILEKGVPKYTDLFSILMRLRVHQIVLFADIEKAFWNVGIREGDRDLLRFLWFEDPDGEDEDMVTYRFKRVCFGLNSSMTLLSSVIHNHLKGYEHDEPKLVQEIERSLYVDDLSIGGGKMKTRYGKFIKKQMIFFRKPTCLFENGKAIHQR